MKNNDDLGLEKIQKSYEMGCKEIALKSVVWLANFCENTPCSECMFKDGKHKNGCLLETETTGKPREWETLIEQARDQLYWLKQENYEI